MPLLVPRPPVPHVNTARLRQQPLRPSDRFVPVLDAQRAAELPQTVQHGARPGVLLQRNAELRPLLSLLLPAVLDQLLELHPLRAARGAAEFRPVAVGHLKRDLRRRNALERDDAGEHFVEAHPVRVDVHRLVVGLSSDDLRSHPVQRPAAGHGDVRRGGDRPHDVLFTRQAEAATSIPIAANDFSEGPMPVRGGGGEEAHGDTTTHRAG